MKYNVLKINRYVLGEYAIVPLRKSDIFLVKKWRNAQMDILRQNIKLTDKDQREYYEHTFLPSCSSSSSAIILFSFLFENKCIGCGGLTNIDWYSRRAEMSFLVDVKRVADKRLYRKDIAAFIALIKRAAFDDLGLNRIFTETFDLRNFHILMLEENGFVLEGRMKEHVFVNGKYVDSLIHGLLRGSS